MKSGLKRIPLGELGSSDMDGKNHLFINFFSFIKTIASTSCSMLLLYHAEVSVVSLGAQWNLECLAKWPVEPSTGSSGPDWSPAECRGPSGPSS